MLKKTITVFTPTYNRAYILGELYSSLCRQTSKDFQWLIVDDGSTDNTKQLIEKWIIEKEIEIIYIYNNNGGKHQAINTGIDKCDTELFVCVDSDDSLTEDAIAIILNYNMLENKEVLGFVGRRGDLNKNALGFNWPSTLKYTSFNNLYFKHNYRGETIIVFKMCYLKNYKFPVFPNENFVSEGVLYDQLSIIAPVKLINEVIYLFEYLPDGYTSSGFKLYFQNPNGYAYFLNQRAVIEKNFITKVKAISQYLAWSRINNMNAKKFIRTPFWLDCLGYIFSPRYSKIYKKELKKIKIQ